MCDVVRPRQVDKLVERINRRKLLKLKKLKETFFWDTNVFFKTRNVNLYRQVFCFGWEINLWQVISAEGSDEQERNLRRPEK